ncbi:hypothetical protein [Nocardia transvalensis]|uniref:hypothetical protein n=1 Tax=Nocardia transvalensis TaxID=37333 RepID=UPI001896319B|nr:hypothetical protein [Nocardia transvalensis]MBF6333594.1 hypothetical protein [Nocardia transvalensis]
MFHTAAAAASSRAGRHVAERPGRQMAASPIETPATVGADEFSPEISAESQPAHRCAETSGGSADPALTVIADETAAALVGHVADVVCRTLLLVDAAYVARLQQVCDVSAYLRDRLLQLEDALAPAIRADVTIDRTVVSKWLDGRIYTAKYEADLITAGAAP